MLKIILGRISEGKTKKIIGIIGERMKTSSPSVLIVPDHVTYNYEQRMCSQLNIKGFIDAEVVSFNRFASSVIDYSGKNRKTFLDDCTKTMVVEKCILNCKEDLLVYKNAVKRKGFASRCLNMISTLENCGYTYEDVLNVSEKLKESNDKILKDGTLIYKLHDTALIFKEYSAILKNGYTDNANRLETAEKLLNNYTPLKNSVVFIDGFDVFTSRLYSFMGELMNNCDVVIGLSSSGNKEDSEAYEIHKTTLNKIIQTAKNNNIEYSIEEVTSEEKTKSPEILFLQDNFYANNSVKYEAEVKNVFVNSYDNPQDEITRIGHRIIDMVSAENSNVRFKDFAILCNDMELYSGIINTTFKRLNIPVYTDAKHDIASHPIALYLFSVLNCVAKGITVERISDYLLSSLTNVSNDERDVFLSDIKRIGITDNELINGTKKDINCGFNELRQKIVLPVISLSDKLKKAENAREISSLCYDFLCENKVYDKVNNLVDAYEKMGEYYLSDVTSQLWNTALRLLEDISSLFDKISIEEYAEILQEGFNASPTSTIPGVIDCVTFGDLQATRESEKKFVYIVGTIEGKIPAVYNDERLVTNKESNILFDYDFELQHSAETEDARIKYNVYSALCAPVKKLFVSYPRFSKTGSVQEPSSVISRIMELFPNLAIISEKKLTTQDNIFNPYSLTELSIGVAKEKVNSDFLMDILENVIESDEASQIKYGLEYKKEISENKVIDNKISELLFDKSMSISQFDLFDKCPLHYFIKYGLKPIEIEEYSPTNIIIGNVVHATIKEFAEKIKYNALITPEECEQITEKLFEEELKNQNYGVMLSTGRQRMLNIILKRIVKDLAVCVKDDFKDYKLKEAEYPFEDNIKTEKSVIHVKGKIDRIDILSKDNKNYLRIVDYKKSSGNLTQLLFYMDIMLKKYQLEGKDIKPGSVKNQIFDKNFEATVNEDSVNEKANGEKYLSESEFFEAIKEMREKIENSINEILGGHANNCISNDNCMFCKYKAICGKFVPKVW